MSEQPVAMAVLASEQLWPNIQALAYWHQRCRLTHLCIYHTGDEVRSYAPAQRLARLCRELYPTVEVELSLASDKGQAAADVGDPLIQPAAVRAQLRAWRTQLANKRFVVNATGGLKLMFAGVLDCIDLPDTEVVYRELGGNDWYRLKRGSDGVQTERFNVPLDVTDSISVETLLRCHWEPAEGRWTADKPHRLPLACLVQEARASQWDWRRAFAACKLAHNVQPGFLFEQFVAASLMALGVKQVALNCHLMAGAQMMLEVDMVANHAGRLLIIDCKLRNRSDTRAEGITSQIRQAAEIRRRLGGLGAELLLLRPGITLSDEERHLAESHGLKVLDARDTLEFFRHLWRFAGGTGPLPEEAAAAQACLDAAAAEGDLEAFASSLPVSYPTQTPPLSTILNVDGILQKSMRDLEQDWVVYRLNNSYVLQGNLPQRLSPKRIRTMVHQRFGQVAEVRQAARSKKGTSFSADLRVDAAHRGEFEELLKQYARKKIFEDI